MMTTLIRRGRCAAGRHTLVACLLASAAVQAFATEVAPAARHHGATATPAARLPASLRGVWFEATADGRHACDRHRRTRLLDTDGSWMDLVGAIVITPALAHHVSEYGEGNFYDVLQVTSTGPGAWRLRSRLGIDTRGDPEAVETVSQLRLTSGLLRWHDADDRDAPSRPAYARCLVDLPPGTER